MDFRYRSLLILLLTVGFFVGVKAQSNSKYTLTPYPDLWYNAVDGPRIGVRFLGEMNDSFNDGPHRLDLGLWLATNLPDNPISYYLSFTEPISFLGNYGSEANVQLNSTIRDGYQRHGVFINKRWQKALNELNHTEISLGLESNKLTESTYRPYPSLWDEDEHVVIRLKLKWNRDYQIGRSLFLMNSMLGVNENSKKITFEFLQLIELSKYFKIRGRVYTGFVNEDIQPQEAFGLSIDSPINWLSNGITRSKGTIPMNLMDSGNFHVAGGANLRGYLQRDFEQFQAGESPLFASVHALNLEAEFWNPINQILSDLSIVRDLSEFRSYLFFDLGSGNQHNLHPEKNTNSNDMQKVLADAGIGFQYSVNIPDFLGQDRAFFIRYDLPFWVSDPIGTDSNIKFRQLIGLGAIFSF